MKCSLRLDEGDKASPTCSKRYPWLSGHGTQMFGRYFARRDTFFSRKTGRDMLPLYPVRSSGRPRPPAPPSPPSFATVS